MPAKTLLMIWALGTALLLSGCFDESNDTSRSFGSGGGPGDGGDPGDGGEQNQAPTIAGTPSANILEGELYEFRPTASDPEGDALQFSIARKPAWAQFDRASGRLWGTPGAADVGNFTNIAISVSDGQATATLADPWPTPQPMPDPIPDPAPMPPIPDPDPAPAK